ncbi:hypothetical protein GQX74_004294 [Glossina fuscipes]|nr:hypothetical protein GQX74_004294 [Glossina fuscipes]
MIATAALLQLMSNPKKTNKRNAQMMDINGHINDLYCALATATAAAAAAAGVHSQLLNINIQANIAQQNIIFVFVLKYKVEVVAREGELETGNWMTMHYNYTIIFTT